MQAFAERGRTKHRNVAKGQSFIARILTDVSDVKFVINFDYPSTSEDYVHRIGRTGRCNDTGTAYTFFTPSNASKAADLVMELVLVANVGF
jgi:Helicase conserved C-terminal domain